MSAPHTPGQIDGGHSEPDKILEWFTPDLVDVLASLDEAPVALANAVVQLLPFGSRAALEDHGLATREAAPRGGGSPSLLLTPLGFQVMAAAAARAADETQAAYVRRAERAAAMADVC
jgi:hypothetical protein